MLVFDGAFWFYWVYTVVYIHRQSQYSENSRCRTDTVSIGQESRAATHRFSFPVSRKTKPSIRRTRASFDDRAWVDVLPWSSEAWKTMALQTFHQSTRLLFYRDKQVAPCLNEKALDLISPPTWPMRRVRMTIINLHPYNTGDESSTSQSWVGHASPEHSCKFEAEK